MGKKKKTIGTGYFFCNKKLLLENPNNYFDVFQRCKILGSFEVRGEDGAVYIKYMADSADFEEVAEGDDIPSYGWYIDPETNVLFAKKGESNG